MEAIAKLKKISISSRKIRLLADLIRDTNIAKASAILKHKPQQCAIYLEKLLRSAVANWKNKNKTSTSAEDSLYIKKITVDSAGMLKRFRPASRGRANRIRKRFSHVTVVVDCLKKSEEVALTETKEKQPNNTTTDGAES